MTRATVDVEAVQRGRLRALATAGECPAAVNDLMVTIGPSPAAAFVRLAEQDNWPRIATSAARRKIVLQRTITKPLTAQCEHVEQLYPVAMGVLVGPPFLHTSDELVEQAKQGLVRRGIDPKFLRKAVRGPAAPLRQPLDAAADPLRRGWDRALHRDAELNHVRAVADFNAAVGHNATADVEDAQELQNLAQTVRREALSEVAQRLKAGEYSSAAMAAARRVTLASHVLATAAVPLAARTVDSRIHDADRGEKTLAVSDCIRDLLWLVAALKGVAWRCTWPQVAAAEELRTAAQLPTFQKKAGLARPSVASLGRRRSSSRSEIELSGVVQKVAITHEANGKAVTRLVVAATDSQTFLARVNGFKADATGAVPGSFVALAGTWDPTASTLDSDTFSGALVVGRDSIAGDRDTSFEAHLRWLTAPVYLPVPHGLHIRSAWVPGFDGPLNPVRYAVTARNI